MAVLAVHLVRTLVVIYMSGQDSNHVVYKTCPKDPSWLFVGPQFHTLPHVHPDRYMGSVVKVFDWIAGTAYSLRNKNVVITGRSGAFGSAIVRRLRSEGPHRTIFDQLEPDILILAHGTNGKDAMDANCTSTIRLVQLYMEQRFGRNRTDATKTLPEIWYVGSEIELHPAFGGAEMHGYLVSKRTFLPYARALYDDPRILYRHIVPAAFQSPMGKALTRSGRREPLCPIPSPARAGDIAFAGEGIEEQMTSLKEDLRTMVSTPVTGLSYPAEQSTISHPAAHSGPQGKSPGRHVVEDATGATIFLGKHSDAPLSLGCRETSASGSGGRMLDDVTIAQFVPRAYPFTSLWGPDATVEEVCETLPEETDLIRYWQAYQSTAYPFYPVLVDVEGFGLSVFEFFNTRASQNATKPDPSWLALLFAVLACGAQFTQDPVKERDLRSKVFTCSSFHCLRISNFFYHTDLDQIQAMALICHCLRNNLDTNTAWILMETTIRLAQSISLHEISLDLPPKEQLRRSRLWWTLIWQDTFLSFTYDRPPSSSATGGCSIPRVSESPGLSFQEFVFKICQIIKSQTQLKGGKEHSSALGCKTKLESVLNDASPFLINKVHCRSLQDHLERLALGIHVGYAICRVSQIHLDSIPDSSSSAVATDSRRRAMRVVENFLELHRLSSTVCRSWAFVHNAVSCAITMHNLAYVAVDGLADLDILAHRLVALLESEAKVSEWYDADTNVRYFGPYSRALKALKEIYGDA
ncbi:fungal-specific transcription factor domain-containing protein [Aspergillus desertorum]